MGLVMKKHSDGVKDEGLGCLDDDDADIGGFFGERKCVWTFYCYLFGYMTHTR